MRRHLTNAVYGVLDYASYPFGMLLTAPIILHNFGASEYGLWMIATAFVSAGGIITRLLRSQHTGVAQLRGSGKIDSMAHAVRSMISINFVLGFTLAAVVWIASPLLARHIAVPSLMPVGESLIYMRIASGLILMRAIESVVGSTQRAFEQYRGTLQISTAVRLLTLASAAVLAMMGWRTPSILVATAVFMFVGTCMQFRELRVFLGPVRV